MLATRIRGDSVFVLGVLFYTAFVLIGPQSSKAHFIAFFGLLLYSWHDALEKNSWVKSAILLVLSVFLGRQGRGLRIAVRVGIAGYCGSFRRWVVAV